MAAFQLPGKGWLQETGSGVFQLPGAGIIRELLTTSTLEYTLEDATGEFSGVVAYVVVLDATLEDATGDVAADYNVNVWRGVSLFSDAGWTSRRETGGDGVAVEAVPGWTQNAPLNPSSAALWRASEPVEVFLGSTWVQAAPVDLPAESGWRESLLQATEIRTDWRYPPGHRIEPRMDHGTADAAAVEVAQPSGFARPLPLAARARWGDSLDHSALEWFFRAGQGTPARMEITVIWQQGAGVEWVFGEGFFRPEPPEPWRYPPSPDLVFACRLPIWDPLHLNLIFTRGGCPWYTPAPIHIGGTIFVENSILVVRLPDRKEIPVTSVRLALEADSWAWGLTLSLEGPNALDDISPVAGDPVSVEVTINGFVWVCQIEDFSESRSFGRTSWTANGRSIAAVLAAPYAPATTYTEDAPKVAAQLCEDRLTNTGWSMAYHDSLAQLMAIDWLVPGGTFSYASKTPLEAIGLVAAAIGARLYADRRYPILHLDPWYPALPWEWDAVTPDAILPEYLARQFSPNLSTKPAYNRVFVSGTNAYGQLVSVKRAGTAGNLAAPMVTDPLITHPLAGRERARTILGDTGKQAQVPVELPLVVDPGLLLPGYIVEVPESSGSWRGLVQSCAIEAAFPTVRHTATIERHYS
jgi:hypothetical protein